MQYHLDTIPVWEAMEADTDCPLCALYEKCERSEVERSLGGSVMEPDERIRVNETGMCARHHQQLYAQQNRLGHALLADSHTKELLKKLNAMEPGKGKRGFLSRGEDVRPLAERLEKLASECVICQNIDAHMKRYFYTFVHLWKTDTSFRQRWEASRGVCIPHACALIRFAQDALSGPKRAAFCQSVLERLSLSLAQDEKDLDWFTLKFDYRNQDKPWGNSRNALERTVNRLRGRCLKDGREA